MSVTNMARDAFSADVAAGNVSGTVSDSGQTRTVGNNPEIQDSISSGELVLAARATPTLGSPTLYWISYSRTPGLVFRINIKKTGPLMFGWATTVPVTSGPHMQNGVISHTTTPYIYNGATGPIVAAATLNLYYQWFLALRATGCQYFVKGGTEYAYPLLVHIDATKNSTPLWPVLTNMNSTGSSRYADGQVGGYFLASPLHSDGFGSSFGTSDGLGHEESSGYGSGGSGVMWTTQSGTWSTSGGKLQAGALSGGIAIATFPTSTKDVYGGVKIIRSVGSGGAVYRWTDINNHLWTEHDGTNCILKQIVGGVTTILITGAAAYSANVAPILSLNGNSARLYYNGAVVGSTSSINAGLTSTTHGVRVTDTTVQLDDIAIYATGTSGEHDAALATLITGTATSDGVTTQTATGTRKRTGTATSDGVTTQTATGTRKRTGTATSDGTGTASASSRVNSRGAGRSDGVGTASAGGARRQTSSMRGDGASTAVIHNHTTSGAVYSS